MIYTFIVFFTNLTPRENQNMLCIFLEVFSFASLTTALLHLETDIEKSVFEYEQNYVSIQGF